MKWFPWLTAHYQLLIQYQQTGRSHHAYLLHSLPNSGDVALFYGLSRWLLCLAPQNSKSCGKCMGCSLMLAENHPDYQVLLPPPASSFNKPTLFGVELIRQLIENITIEPQQNGRRVIILHQAERLTTEAMHALLKLVEEPPDKTYFLLSTYQLKKIILTLRSRCFYYYLPAPSKRIGLYWLQQQQGSCYDERIALTALQLADGVPQVAYKLLHPAYWTKRAHYFELLQRAFDTGEFLPLVKEMVQQDQVTLLWFSSFILDLLKCKKDLLAYIVNQDMKNSIVICANHYATTAVTILLQHWLQSYTNMQTIVGVNHELLLTNHLLRWEAYWSFSPINV